jgi:hypothetical protein
VKSSRFSTFSCVWSKKPLIFSKEGNKKAAQNGGFKFFLSARVQLRNCKYLPNLKPHTKIMGLNIVLIG